VNCTNKHKRCCYYCDAVSPRPVARI